jgi:hypothetical protein
MTACLENDSRSITYAWQIAKIGGVENTRVPSLAAARAAGEV